jgi:hypothetical protein
MCCHALAVRIFNACHFPCFPDIAGGGGKELTTRNMIFFIAISIITIVVIIIIFFLDFFIFFLFWGASLTDPCLQSLATKNL